MIHLGWLESDLETGGQCEIIREREGVIAQIKTYYGKTMASGHHQNIECALIALDEDIAEEAAKRKDAFYEMFE